jgi:hypothetical protein
MIFKYRGLTANCGNDAIGTDASKNIAEQVKNDNADFYVINCQEVDFKKTLKQLQDVVPKDYTVTISPHVMATHTKLAMQFHGGTGIATFVIHKNDLTVEFSNSRIIRRHPSRLGDGIGYNKGGLVSDISIKKPDSNKFIKIQALSGHLDSANTIKRSQDWHNLNKALTRNVGNWDELVQTCPHLRLAGYDANTRNKIEVGDKLGEKIITNLWLKSPNSPEIQALFQAVLGNQRFSGESTYKTSLNNITLLKDKRRPGYVRGGMLDFVDIADGNKKDQGIITEGVVQIPPEDSTERDHDVIMSPLQGYTMLLDFDQVKGQMAIRLAQVAPNMAQEIRDLTETDESKKQLLEVFQLFLSPEGLLNKTLELHIQKLESLEKNIDFSVTNDLVKQKIIDTLFPDTPWFESVTFADMNASTVQLNQKIQLIQVLITSLNVCQSQTGCERRLDWFQDQVKNIENKTYDHKKAVDYFKNKSIDEYSNNYQNFRLKLSSYTQKNDDEQNFCNSGFEILKQLDQIIVNENQLASLNPKIVSQINRVLERCAQAIDAIKEGGKIEPIAYELAKLSQEVSGKASPKWQALGTGLLLFACAALVVASFLAAIPTCGTSLLSAAAGLGGAGLIAGATGIGIQSASSEKGLAKTISHYRSALKELVNESDFKSSASELAP